MMGYVILSEDTVECTCISCKNKVQIKVGKDGMSKLTRPELHIQDALPNVSKDLREMFVSGICPKCYAAMFAYMDVEEE